MKHFMCIMSALLLYYLHNFFVDGAEKCKIKNDKTTQAHELLTVVTLIEFAHTRLLMKKKIKRRCGYKKRAKHERENYMKTF